MSSRMGPVEAANVIRAVFKKDRMSHMSPEYVHELKFVEEVCDQLGADKNPQTVMHVRNLLREAGVDLPKGQEYPKYVKRGYDGAMLVARDEQHAREIENAIEPEPADPAPYLNDPDKDAPSDISGNVPEVTQRESVLKRDDGRVPSDISKNVPQVTEVDHPVDPDLTDLAAGQGMPDPLDKDRTDHVVIGADRVSNVNDDVIDHDPQDDIDLSEDNQSTHDNKLVVDADPFKDNGEHTIVKPEDLKAPAPKTTKAAAKPSNKRPD